MPMNAPTEPPNLNRSTRLLRKVLPLAIALLVVIGITGVIRLVLIADSPLPGFILMWRKELKLFTVGWSTPPGWQGIEGGMQINDRILCIDGYQPSSDSAVYGLDPRYDDVLQ